MQSIGRWADASGHPSGATLVADGYTGVFVYAGTPGRAKNVTRAVYADYVANGLPVIAVYENVADDISSGAGAQHARDLIADLANVGAPTTIPICAAADEHLTAGQIPTAVGYQGDFYRTAKAAGWDGLVGGYGFSEFTRAINAAGLSEWLWQCGSASMLWDGVTFWQRNDGFAYVGGVQCDINEQYQPLQEDTVSFTDVIGKRPDGSPITAADALANLYLGAYFGGGDAGASAVFPAVNYLKQTFNRYPDSATNGDRDPKTGTPIYDAAENTRRLVNMVTALGAQVAALTAAVAKLLAEPNVTPDELKTMLDTAVAQHLQITGTVEIKGQ